MYRLFIVLDVGALTELPLTRWRRGGGQHSHLLLELNQTHVDIRRRRAALELLELTRQRVAGELFIDLDRCLELPFTLLDALFHPRERLERRLLGK